MVLRNEVGENDVVLTIEEMDRYEQLIKEGYELLWCGQGKLCLHKEEEANYGDTLLWGSILVTLIIFGVFVF